MPSPTADQKKKDRKNKRAALPSTPAVAVREPFIPPSLRAAGFSSLGPSPATFSTGPPAATGTPQSSVSGKAKKRRRGTNGKNSQRETPVASPAPATAAQTEYQSHKSKGKRRRHDTPDEEQGSQSSNEDASDIATDVEAASQPRKKRRRQCGLKASSPSAIAIFELPDSRVYQRSLDVTTLASATQLASSKLNSAHVALSYEGLRGHQVQLDDEDDFSALKHSAEHQGSVVIKVRITSNSAPSTAAATTTETASSIEASEKIAATRKAAAQRAAAQKAAAERSAAEKVAAAERLAAAVKAAAEKAAAAAEKAREEAGKAAAIAAQPAVNGKQKAPSKSAVAELQDAGNEDGHGTRSSEGQDDEIESGSSSSSGSRPDSSSLSSNTDDEEEAEQRDDETAVDLQPPIESSSTSNGTSSGGSADIISAKAAGKKRVMVEDCDDEAAPATKPPAKKPKSALAKLEAAVVAAEKQAEASRMVAQDCDAALEAANEAAAEARKLLPPKRGRAASTQEQKDAQQQAKKANSLAEKLKKKADEARAAVVAATSSADDLASTHVTAAHVPSSSSAVAGLSSSTAFQDAEEAEQQQEQDGEDLPVYKGPKQVCVVCAQRGPHSQDVCPTVVAGHTSIAARAQELKDLKSSKKLPERAAQKLLETLLKKTASDSKIVGTTSAPSGLAATIGSARKDSDVAAARQTRATAQRLDSVEVESANGVGESEDGDTTQGAATEVSTAAPVSARERIALAKQQKAAAAAKAKATAEQEKLENEVRSARDKVAQLRAAEAQQNGAKLSAAEAKSSAAKKRRAEQALAKAQARRDAKLKEAEHSRASAEAGALSQVTPPSKLAIAAKVKPLHRLPSSDDEEEYDELASQTQSYIRSKPSCIIVEGSPSKPGPSSRREAVPGLSSPVMGSADEADTSPMLQAVSASAPVSKDGDITPQPLPPSLNGEAEASQDTVASPSSGTPARRNGPLFLQTQLSQTQQEAFDETLGASQTQASRLQSPKRRETSMTSSASSDTSDDSDEDDDDDEDEDEDEAHKSGSEAVEESDMEHSGGEEEHAAASVNKAAVNGEQSDEESISSRASIRSKPESISVSSSLANVRARRPSSSSASIHSASERAPSEPAESIQESSTQGTMGQSIASLLRPINPFAKLVPAQHRASGSSSRANESQPPVRPNAHQRLSELKPSALRLSMSQPASPATSTGPHLELSPALPALQRISQAAAQEASETESDSTSSSDDSSDEEANSKKANSKKMASSMPVSKRAGAAVGGVKKKRQSMFDLI